MNKYPSKEERRARYGERLKAWAEGVRAIVDGGEPEAGSQKPEVKTTGSLIPEATREPARLPYAD